MAKLDPKLEELKAELREVLVKVEARYAELYIDRYDDPVYFKRVRSSAKNLITRVLNGTS